MSNQIIQDSQVSSKCILFVVKLVDEDYHYFVPRGFVLMEDEQKGLELL